MKVIAFGASSSRNSINRQLARYAAQQVAGADVEVLDLNDYELPLFSTDREAELGQPALAQAFRQKLAEADAIIISFAEHNSNYTVAFKNLFDWCSRIDRNIFADKPVVLLSTSPGARGGASVLELATGQFPRFGAQVKASLALSKFGDFFDVEASTVTDVEVAKKIKNAVATLSA